MLKTYRIYNLIVRFQNLNSKTNYWVV